MTTIHKFALTVTTTTAGEMRLGPDRDTLEEATADYERYRTSPTLKNRPPGVRVVVREALITLTDHLMED